MILDTKKIKLQRSIDDGALYIIEQVPNLVAYSDQTNILRKGKYLCKSFWIMEYGRGQKVNNLN